MKILIASDCCSPTINGVVTSASNLAKGLRKKGHEVRVLTLSGKFSSRREGNTYYIASVPADWIYPDIKITIPGRHKLIKELIEWKPDVIHTQSEFFTFSLARKISKMTGAPIVHTYHTTWEDYTHYFCPSRRLGIKITYFYMRMIASKTDEFIVPSIKMYRVVSGYHIKPNLHVVPTGIELEEYTKDHSIRRKEIRKKLGISENECLLIFIGRLGIEKNLQEIIRYLTDERLKNLRLFIVGDGPYRKNLEKEVRAFGLSDRIFWGGLVSPKEVAGYYAAGDIFVNASKSETQGLTYMEAMASGLPVLCRKDPCLDGVVENGENGFLYKNKKEFMKNLKLLLDHQDLRKRLGEEARKTVLRTYSIPAFAGACEKIYLQAIEKNTR